MLVSVFCYRMNRIDIVFLFAFDLIIMLMCSQNPAEMCVCIYKFAWWDFHHIGVSNNMLHPSVYLKAKFRFLSINTHSHQQETNKKIALNQIIIRPKQKYLERHRAAHSRQNIASTCAHHTMMHHSSMLAYSVQQFSNCIFLVETVFHINNALVLVVLCTWFVHSSYTHRPRADTQYVIRT